MAIPADTDFVITQKDTLPVMRIPIPANSAGQLLDLAGCTVTFLGRVKDTRTFPPPIVRPIESYAEETATATDAAVLGITEDDPIIAVYVHLEATDTEGIAVPTTADFVEMEGELEIVDGDGEVLTIPNDPETPYLKWWVRDDIGDGA